MHIVASEDTNLAMRVGAVLHALQKFSIQVYIYCTCMDNHRNQVRPLESDGTTGQ